MMDVKKMDQKDEKISYENNKCAGCGRVHITSILISMHNLPHMVLCLSCARAVKEALDKVKT